MPKELAKFQQKMAEHGHELTPDEAAELYRLTSEILDRAKRMSQVDLWNMLESDTSVMSPEVKQEIVDLYQYAREC